ncbi:MAG: ABC transporter permease [Deltaproteobacteria bacterium]|nr:ABC transporter permease [Deltaproteobacteria bacterium]
MTQYIIRRLLLMIPTLLLISMFTFSAVRLIPGDVLYNMIGDAGVNMRGVQAEAGAGGDPLAILKRRLGLDKPLHEQYVIYMGNVLRGDLGRSLFDNTPVLEKVLVRLPVTLELGIMALSIAVLFAIPIGILSAIRQDTFLDYLLRTVAIGQLSIPNFWIATLVVVLPAVFWGRTIPITYVPFSEAPLDNVKQFLLPAFLIGTHSIGVTMRLTRTMMLEVMRQDYIRTAWAKGLAERVVIFRHALRNAVIPVITVFGIQVAYLLGGTVIIESIFGLPGMGTLLIDAINRKDYPYIQSINLLVAVWVLSVNLLIDLSYAYLDPRIRYSRS